MLLEVLLVAVVLEDHLGVAVDQPIGALHLRGVQLVLQLLALPAAGDWHRQTFYDHKRSVVEVLLNSRVLFVPVVETKRINNQQNKKIGRLCGLKVVRSGYNR